MHQDRLFRLAVEAGSVVFIHEPGVGWRLSVNIRRGDEQWDETETEVYRGLSTQEMLDTVYAHLDSAL